MSQSITLGCSVTRQRSPPLRTRTAKAAGTAIAVLVLSVTLDATASARGWTAAARQSCGCAAPPSLTTSAVAPEIDPASALSGLTLLLGTLAILRGRRSRRPPQFKLRDGTQIHVQDWHSGPVVWLIHCLRRSVELHTKVAALCWRNLSGARECFLRTRGCVVVSPSARQCR